MSEQRRLGSAPHLHPPSEGALTPLLSSQNGRLSKELDLVGHHVRTRLDELKRQEVSRLRMLLKAKLDSTSVQSQSIHCIIYTLPCSPLELHHT